MPEPSARRKPVATLRQLVLIAVLGVILAVVLIVQFGGASHDSEAPKSGGRTPAAAAKAASGVPGGSSAQASSAAAVKEPAAASEPAKVTPWPELSGQSAAQHDPFAMPEPFSRQLALQEGEGSRSGKRAAPRQNTAGEQALAALRTKGITTVLRDDRGAVAIIDNKAVRVGDMLHGYRVLAIESDGVLVAPADSSEGKEDQKR